MARIVVVDDHEQIRAGLVELLDAEPDFTVVGESADGSAAVELAHRLLPDVIVMDLHMPTLDGAAAATEILRHRPGTQILILTGAPDGYLAALARAARVAACLPKSASPQTLIDTVRALAGGLPHTAEPTRDSPAPTTCGEGPIPPAGFQT